MRILYISRYFSFNPSHAAEVVTYEIVNRLANNGCEMTVVAPNVNLSNFRDTEICENIKIITNNNFSKYNIRESLLSSYISNSFLYIPLVLKALEKSKFDIIISMHHATHFATPFGFCMSRILNIPIIAKSHDTVIYTSKLNDPIFWRRIYKKAFGHLNMNVLRNCDSILVVSKELKKIVECAYELKPEKVEVFPNGVDINQFNPHIDGEAINQKINPEGKNIILYSGGSYRERGVELLIKALPEIISENRNFIVLLLGEDPEKGKIMKLAKDNHLEKHVISIGKVHHLLVPKFISIADITIGPLLAFPTTWGAVPTKILEYMACSKPIIASKGSVSNDLVINNYNGILTSPGSVKEISKSIIMLLDDNNLRNRLGENARHHVEMSYSWNVLIKNLKRIINSVIEEN